MEPAPVQVAPPTRERELEAAFAALPDGAAVVRDGIVLHANAALAEILGVPVLDLVDRPLRLPEAGSENGGRVRRLRRADGAVVHAEVTARALASGDGLTLVLVRALADAPRGPLPVRGMPGYVFTVARDGTILRINRVAPGLRVEDIVGANQFALLHTDDRDHARAANERVLATGKEETYEVRAVVQGELRWYENHVAPAPDEPDACIVLSLDVTPRKSAEERAERTMRVLTSLLDANQRLASELDAERVIEVATDAARILTGAAFGAFFHNVEDSSGRSYMLYALSGAPRTAFERFPLPRATPLFAPTFRGERTIRLDDVTKAEEYGRNPPHHGMPEGHLPVRSYLAVPVVSRTGKVHGGLFFGHPEPGMFTAEAQSIAEGLAAQAAVALDNAALYRGARESEARFRGLADAMPQMVWSTTAEGQVEWANRRWHEYTGQTPEEVRGDGWVEVVHPDDVPRVVEAWRRATGTGEAYETTQRYRRASDGAYRWHLARASPIRDDDGRIVRWFGTCTDIHDQQVASERFRESEERYRFLTENVGDVIVRSSVDGVFLDLTPASARVLGYAPEELVGRSILTVADEADRDVVRGVRASVLAGKRDYVVQLRARKKTGERIWIEVNGRVVRDGSGRTIEVISSIRDVTERKNAEAALRESEERFRLLSASSPVGIFLADKDGRALYVNPACARICGFPPQQALAEGWTESIHPQDRARVGREWTEYVKGTSGEYRSTFRWLHPDGEVYWSHVRAAPLLQEGVVTGHVGTVEDITPLRRAAQELERTRAELVQGEKMSALGSLVAGVAHELRTPLTYLGTNLDLVERAVERLIADLPEEKRDAVRARLHPRLMDAREGMDRINKLVEDLRRFTKVRSDGERQLLDLAPVVDEAVGLFRATRRGDVKVEDDLRPTPLRPIDRVQLQQVVLNLLENAREARPQDAVIRIRTRTDEEGRPVLEVEDKGPGVPPEVQARMWDPFFTTKPEGSGLGLAIVKRIADAHGAIVECESRPSEGATFRLTF